MNYFWFDLSKLSASETESDFAFNL